MKIIKQELWGDIEFHNYHNDIIELDQYIDGVFNSQYIERKNLPELIALLQEEVKKDL